MFGRHALHDEDHDVAARKVHGCAVRRLVHGREAPRQLLRGEVFLVFDASCAADGAQDAERIAQDEVGLAAVGGVERGVRQGDRARHAGHAAAYPGDAQPRGCREDHRVADVIGPSAAENALFPHPAAVSPRQQGGQGDPQKHQIPVLGHEFPDQLQRVVVVGEEDFVGCETLLRVAEIDRVGEVRRHDQHGVDCDVVPEQHGPVPAPFAQGQGQQRQQDEHPVGVDDRGGVEFQRSGQQRPRLGPRQGAEHGGVVEVERRAAEHQHRVEQHDAPHEQRQRRMEQAFHPERVIRRL